MERPEKALDFANYLTILGNQQRTIPNNVYPVLQTVHYSKGVFFADLQTISFVKALIDCDKKQSVIIDSKKIPLIIEDLQDFLDTLFSAYNESMNEYKPTDKIKKLQETRKSLMDW